MLIVLDLETTGLDPVCDEILEVGAIAVDDKLEEVARFHALVLPSRDLWEMGEFVRDMHTKNDLLYELRQLRGSELKSHINAAFAPAVSARLAAFIRGYGVKMGEATDKDGNRVRTLDRPQLCGNTIGFDKSFLRVHMPEAHAELSYRSLDVSTLNTVAKLFFPSAYESAKQVKPDGDAKEHRAMWDATCSLLQLRAYTKLLTTHVDRAEAAERVCRLLDYAPRVESPREFHQMVADAALGFSK